MSHSRKRHGHRYQKPADIPSGQRTKGRIVWASLLAVFGLLIALFASGGGVPIAVIGAVSGAAIGYVIGKNMERQASGK